MSTPKALRQRSLQCIFWLALLILAPRAWAHEFWLVAYPARSEIAQPVALELRIGAGWPGTQSPRRPNLVDWFSAFDADGSTPVLDASSPEYIGEFKPRAAGATLIALRSNPARTTLSADEFNQYLQEEGLTQALAMRQRFELLQSPVREQFSRCAKSIVVVGGSSQGYDGLSNLPLELQLLSDPLSISPDQALQLKLTLHGKPLAGSLIKAQPQHDPEQKLSAISDEQGLVRLTLNTPGVWLLSAVHIEPSASAGVDWESLWTSLTVEIL